MMRTTPFTQTDQMLCQALDKGVFPSFAAAIGTREAVLYRKVGGNAAVWPDVRLAREDTLYDLASLSKWLATTLSALRLSEQKMLDLDQPINHYMDVPQDKAAITIRNLLCHTAGFEAHFMLQNCCASPQDAAQAILSRPLAYHPGKQVVYSCMGFILLGKILEQTSGLNLEQLARELVFEPLSMSKTGYRPSSAVSHQPSDGSFAATERDPCSGQYICGQVHDENARFLGGVSGNAGVFAPLSDMIVMANCMLDRGQGLISPELFQQMVNNWTEGLNEARGLGVTLLPRGHRVPENPFSRTGAFGHTGFTGTSLFISNDPGLYFILLTNRVHYGRNLQIMPEYRKLFHEAALNDWFSQYK